MKALVAVLLCGCVAAVSSQYVVAKVEKAKFRVASLDPVTADTPADTTLLKTTEKEVEVPAARYITYAAHPSPVFAAIGRPPHGRKRRALVVAAKVEKAKVRVASLDPVAADTPADTTLLKATEKEVEVPAARYITYAAHPSPVFAAIGGPPHGRKRRALVVAAKVEKAKVRVASLDPVAADTPADTTLLKATEKEVEVPAARYITYAAHPSPVFAAIRPPHGGGGLGKRRKRALVVAAKVEKAKVRVASLDPVAADTPADTTLLKATEKEVEVPAARYITYAAHPSPVFFGRKKRDLVAKVRTAGLGAVAADTPADTALLQPIVSEHSFIMPSARMVYMI